MLQSLVGIYLHTECRTLTSFYNVTRQLLGYVHDAIFYFCSLVIKNKISHWPTLLRQKILIFPSGMPWRWSFCPYSTPLFSLLVAFGNRFLMYIFTYPVPVPRSDVRCTEVSPRCHTLTNKGDEFMAPTSGSKGGAQGPGSPLTPRFGGPSYTIWRPSV